MSTTCLRVIWPDGLPPSNPPDPLSPRNTLSEFYFRHFEPHVLADARRPEPANRTIEEYRYSIARWIELTGDPPLCAIDDRTLEHFCRRYLERPGLRGPKISRATLDKNIRQLQHVLDWAGPRQRRGRRLVGYGRHGLFGYDSDGQPRPVPLFGPCSAREAIPRPMPITAIEQWIEAAAEAKRPAALSPDYRRNLIAAFLAWSYYVGTRVETTYHLRWEMLRGHWLLIPADIFKGRRRDVVVYVSSAAIAVASAIRRSDNTQERMFPVPCLLRSWLNILAGVRDASAMPETEKFGGTHRLRSRLLTTLAAQNVLIARLQAGHSVRGDMLLEHYVAGRDLATASELAEWPRLLESVPKLWMPDWFPAG